MILCCERQLMIIVQEDLKVRLQGRTCTDGNSWHIGLYWLKVLWDWSQEKQRRAIGSIQDRRELYQGIEGLQVTCASCSTTKNWWRYRWSVMNIYLHVQCWTLPKLRECWKNIWKIIFLHSRTHQTDINPLYFVTVKHERSIVVK
jgi:hypothetical protein